ncbi:hypothetical protein YC2023_054928 [Brassica napus]
MFKMRQTHAGDYISWTHGRTRSRQYDNSIRSSVFIEVTVRRPLTVPNNHRRHYTGYKHKLKNTQAGYKHKLKNTQDLCIESDKEKDNKPSLLTDSLLGRLLLAMDESSKCPGTICLELTCQT